MALGTWQVSGGRLASDLTVHVGKGHYYLPHGLSFGPEDSGRDGFDVVYQGAGAGTQLHGGVPVSSAWVPDSTGAAGGAVPAGSIWRTNVTAALASANVTATRFFQLIRPGGVPARLARLPKAGSGYLPELGCATGKGLTFTCPPGVLPDALAGQVADAGVYANLGANWFTDLRQVLKATKASNGGMAVAFEPGASSTNTRVYIQGALRAPFSSTQMWANSISPAHPRVRPMGALSTCRRAGEIKKITHPKNATALFRDQARRR